MSGTNNPGEHAHAAHGTENLKEKVHEVSQNLRDMGDHVRETASEKFHELRDQAGDYYKQGRDRAKDWEHSLESYVQEKPVKAILIAAGVGLLLGLLWKRS
jgi:ElaB/YqjD/DUF883 family membrane-anchored ribosome-binding protein